MTSTRPLMLSCLATLALTTLACSSRTDSDDVGEVRENIVNGTNMTQTEVNQWGLVAIYHPDDIDPSKYFPRPCSGTILAGSTGGGVVLTARHCVTSNGEPTGTVVAANKLMLIATNNPGPTRADGTPPVGAQPAYFLAAPPTPLHNVVSEDIALIWIHADYSAHVTARRGIWVGGPDRAHAGIDTAMGYGINVVDANCDTDRTTAGAGVARRSGALLPTSPTWSFFDRNFLIWYYTYVFPNSAGQYPNCGDSGGPDFGNFSFNSSTVVSQLLGEHSGTGGSVGISLWAQQLLGGLNLGPLGTTPNNLHRPLNMHTVSLSTTQSTGWIYEWRSFQLFDPIQEDIDQDWCLDVSGSNVVANLCNGATSQKWYLDTTLRIRNGSITGQCLTANGSGAKVASCVDSPSTQAWTFHAQR